MLEIIRQPLQVMLTFFKRLPIQNISPSFLVIFVRETTLLVNALLSRRCEESGFMVIPFLNILKLFNNQPLLVRLDLVTQPLVFMLGANSHPLQVMLRENSQPLLVMLTPLKKLVPFFNILKLFNNQPLLVRLDLVTRPLVFMQGQTLILCRSC